MPVSMLCPRWHLFSVPMLVVLVVNMLVFVFQGLVDVLMAMLLCKMEPHARASVHFGGFWQFGQMRTLVDLFGYHSLCCFLCGDARSGIDDGHSSDRFGRGRTTL